VPFRSKGELIKLTVELQPVRGMLAETIEFKVQTRDYPALGSEEGTGSVSEELR